MLTIRDIVKLQQEYLDQHGRSPNVIRIARGAEYDLELPDDLKSRATIEGPRAVLPRIHGMRVEWDAERTEVDHDDPLPPFVQG